MKQLRMLAIDTSTEACSAALLWSDGEVRQRFIVTERGHAELEEVPQAIGGPCVEQQAPARPSGAIERREEERAIDSRLKDEAALDKSRVGEAPDPLTDEELVQPL